MGPGAAAPGGESREAKPPWRGVRGAEPLARLQRLARRGVGCYSKRPNPRVRPEMGARPGGQREMKLQAARATWVRALPPVKGCVDGRTPTPFHPTVLIPGRGGKLQLTATDMEIAIVEDVPASTTRNGACPAPAATLYEIVRRLPDGA